MKTLLRNNMNYDSCMYIPKIPTTDILCLSLCRKIIDNYWNLNSDSRQRPHENLDSKVITFNSLFLCNKI